MVFAMQHLTQSNFCVAIVHTSAFVFELSFGKAEYAFFKIWLCLCILLVLEGLLHSQMTF